MSIKSIRTLAVAAAAALVLAACQAPAAVDKAGGAVTTLRLATIDEVNSNGQAYGPQAFVDSLAEVSGGMLKVEVTEEYGSGEATAESDMVKAIASGDLDGGWPATRAFASAGISGLEVVEAPMVISSYAAEKALVTSPAAATLLQQLKGSGVVGLGLSVGPLRRPFAAKSALLGPSDWKGIRFRTYNSPVQVDSIRALGAVPVNVGFAWIDEVHAGKLHGAEFDIAQYDKNGNNGTDAGQITGNVVLWPKLYVLSLSQKRFDALSTEQRGWVQQAADLAVKASVDASYDEAQLASQLCGRGVHFHTATASQEADLKKALAPVLNRLAADTTSGPLLTELQAIAAASPADLVDPAECGSGQQNNPLGTIPSTVSSLPSGTYRAAVTVDDLNSRGMDKESGMSGTWTLKVADGKYELSCRPLALPGIDCAQEVYNGPLDVGDLRGSKNVVYFIYNAERKSRMTGCKLPVSQNLPGHCFAGRPYRMAWAIDGDQLTFSDYRSDNWPNDMFIVKPWRKIA